VQKASVSLGTDAGYDLALGILCLDTFEHLLQHEVGEDVVRLNGVRKRTENATDRGFEEVCSGYSTLPLPFWRVNVAALSSWEPGEAG
jgi:hypothetical protein